MFVRREKRRSSSSNNNSSAGKVIMDLYIKSYHGFEQIPQENDQSVSTSGLFLATFSLLLIILLISLIIFPVMFVNKTDKKKGKEKLSKGQIHDHFS